MTAVPSDRDIPCSLLGNMHVISDINQTARSSSDGTDILLMQAVTVSGCWCFA